MPVEEIDRRTYKVSEVSKMLGLGETKTLDLIKSGEIPSRRFGRRIVIPREAFDRWLAELAS